MFVCVALRRIHKPNDFLGCKETLENDIGGQTCYIVAWECIETDNERFPFAGVPWPGVFSILTKTVLCFWACFCLQCV